MIETNLPGDNGSSSNVDQDVAPAEIVFDALHGGESGVAVNDIGPDGDEPPPSSSANDWLRSGAGPTGRRDAAPAGRRIARRLLELVNCDVTVPGHARVPGGYCEPMRRRRSQRWIK